MLMLILSKSSKNDKMPSGSQLGQPYKNTHEAVMSDLGLEVSESWADIPWQCSEKSKMAANKDQEAILLEIVMLPWQPKPQF